MNYSRDGFTALLQEVETQGGALLPDVCTEEKIEYKTKDGRVQEPQAYTCGCGNKAVFVAPYDGEPQNPNLPYDQEKDTAHFVRFCAVCDSGGAWPRFAEAVYEADPTMDVMWQEKNAPESEEESGS